MDHPGRANPKHLLQLRGLDASTIRAILTRAESLRAGAMRPVSDALRGTTVATLFLEASTRTRTSFQLAATRLGAEVVDLSGSGLSVSKGETLADTAQTIEAMGVDAIVVRAGQSGAPHVIADAVRCGVLNAGDGRHAHPPQGLLAALARAAAHVGDRTAGIADLLSEKQPSRGTLAPLKSGRWRCGSARKRTII